MWVAIIPEIMRQSDEVSFDFGVRIDFFTRVCASAAAMPTKKGKGRIADTEALQLLSKGSKSGDLHF